MLKPNLQVFVNGNLFGKVEDRKREETFHSSEGMVGFTACLPASHCKFSQMDYLLECFDHLYWVELCSPLKTVKPSTHKCDLIWERVFADVIELI